MLLALSELPSALGEWASLPFASSLLAGAPRGDGHPVLVLPGFATTDSSTKVLRRFLKDLGYDAHSWDLGRNLGHKAIGRDGEKLIDRLRAIHDATGEKVSLVGWSLGGVMARLAAHKAPELVRQVVTLGSPFAGSPKSTTVWRAYEWLTGDKVDDQRIVRQLDENAGPPPVPSTAIWSRSDGVVAWQTCREREAATTDNIEVRGSHCGLGVNPSVLYAVADRLAQPDDHWAPFKRDGFKAWVYPSAGHA
jgi:pimeloyl-ACP methyl ester carboxylesterase